MGELVTKRDKKKKVKLVAEEEDGWDDKATEEKGSI